MLHLCVCVHSGSLESTQKSRVALQLTSVSCCRNLSRAQFLDLRTLTIELIVKSLSQIFSGAWAGVTQCSPRPKRLRRRKIIYRLCMGNSQTV